MPMQAYLDESGIHSGSKKIVMAGLAAGRQKVKALEKSWLDLLRDYDIPLNIGLHAKTLFARSTAGTRFGPYQGWNEIRVRALIDAVVGQIEAHQLNPIVASVTSALFHQRTHNFRRLITGGIYDSRQGKWLSSGAPNKPYFFVFHQALVRGCANAKPGVLVDFIFDRQDDFSGLAIKIWNTLKGDTRWEGGSHLGGIAFYSRFERPCLQLADFLAFCVYNVEEYREDAKNLDIAYAIHRLIQAGISVANMDRAMELLEPIYPAKLKEEDDQKSRVRGVQRSDERHSPC